MSQFSNQIVKSFMANQSIGAYVVVSRAATSTMSVLPWNTTTSFVLGVSLNAASTGEAVNVVIGGTAKVACAASVSVGAIVGPNTVTSNLNAGPGCIVERAASFTSTALYKNIGIALEAGSTNSVIEVLIQPNHVSGA